MNSKKNSCHGNYMRKYGTYLVVKSQLDMYSYVLEIVLDFDSKTLSFKTRKKSRISLELKLKSTKHLST